jgi:hypothetical protein
MFKKLFLLFVVCCLLFVVGLFMGSITVVVYGGIHICRGCKGTINYCQEGNVCKIIATGQNGTFTETKSGKHCNGFSFFSCEDKLIKCWCSRGPVGGAGDAYAPNPGCD